MLPGQSWGQMARLSASGTAPEESDDDENSACGSGGGCDHRNDEMIRKDKKNEGHHVFASLE